MTELTQAANSFATGLKCLMEQHWCGSVSSDRAFFQYRRQDGTIATCVHVALAYAAQSDWPEDMKRLTDRMWEDLKTLPRHGVLVFREPPVIDFVDGTGVRLYLRISFIDGPTEDELMALPSYKAEACQAKVLA